MESLLNTKEFQNCTCKNFDLNVTVLELCRIWGQDADSRLLVLLNSNSSVGLILRWLAALELEGSEDVEIAKSKNIRDETPPPQNQEKAPQSR